MKKQLRKAALMLASLGAFLPSAHAAVYDLADFSINYSGASLLEGTIETSQTGTFTTEAGIENFLNAANYSVSFYDGSNQLFNLNNTNASWDLQFSFESVPQTTSAVLEATSSAITLNFDTPRQPTSVALLLGTPSIGYIQYRQSNNITDSNFFGADFNAVHSATAGLPYDSSFVLPANTPAVPEPSQALLLLGGLGALAFIRRKTTK